MGLGMVHHRIEGRGGEIRIESLGVVVGTVKTWVCTRREENTPGAGLFDLHAAFSYLNPNLWADSEYEKVFTVHLGKNVYRVEQEAGYPTSIEGRLSLRMQGVRLCQ